MAEETKGHIDLKHGLRSWAAKNEVSPSEFGKAMGYSDAYGWSIMRGAAPVTVGVLGRFVLAYGVQATDELMTLAGMPNNAHRHGIENAA